MKVKEFKNRQVIKVKMSAYSDDHGELIKRLNAVGIVSVYKDSCFLLFDASLKQLLQLEELGVDLSKHTFRVDVMGKM